MNTTPFKDEMHHLKIELLEDGLIRLENESMGYSYALDVHPMQLRYMAERVGLIAEVSASDAELLRTERGRVADLERTLDRYKRTLLHFKVRAEQLHDNIFNCSQRGHEDLGIEVAQSAALADFAENICVEFEDGFTAIEPDPHKVLPTAMATAAEPRKVKTGRSAKGESHTSQLDLAA